MTTCTPLLHADNMENKDNLASVVKAYRMDRELTLQELSDRCGVSVSTLHRIERGFPVHELTLARITKRLRGLRVPGRRRVTR